jgi:hypothetical protein
LNAPADQSVKSTKLLLIQKITKGYWAISNNLSKVKVFISLFLSALVATLMWVYYLSQGFTQPGLLDAFIDIQAFALQNGRIAITPDYHHIFYHDVSLYNGNYYFYWGILPSVLHAFLWSLVGKVISSYFLVSLFLFFFVYFFQRVILEIILTSTSVSSLPKAFPICAAIILSWLLIFNIPLPYDMYRDAWFFGHFIIYEQHMIFGMSLALAGLFYLIKGQKDSRPTLLIAAACLFAMAAWVRVTWFVFSMLAIPAILGTFMTRKNPTLVLKWHHYVFMAVSVILMGSLMALNFARFGDIFDFGLKLQNPQNYLYIHIQNGLFSPITIFFNTVYKILAYYTFPGFIQFSGVFEKSSSFSEDMEPFLLHNNPFFLIFIPFVLYGFYRAFSLKLNMRRIIIVLGAAALIINGVIVFMGNIVTTRYFVECYWLTMLFVLAGLMVALPVKVSLPVFVLILGIHLPGNIKAFLETRPELRIIEVIEKKQNNVDYRSLTRVRTFFIYKDVHWHEGIVTASQKETFTKYNTIGMLPLQNGMMGAADISAVYIKPQDDKKLSQNKAVLEICGIRSFRKPGLLRVYMEKTKIVEFNLVPDEARTYKTIINYNLKRGAPYRLLMYFFEENKSYLPVKPSDQPSFLFETIHLSRI